MERSAQSQAIPAPARLVSTQEWFGGAIATPMQPDSKLASGVILGAGRYLTRGERIEIYHQQYWWRLLKTLQNNFPFLTEILGYEAFNQQIAIPYLTDHPPSHWALCRLGHLLPDWIRDERLSLCARIDWAANFAFWAPELASPDFSLLEGDQILEAPLTLQPHISLFALEEDLLTMREEKLGAAEKRPCFNVIYRSPAKTVCWKEITKEQFLLLSLLKSCTIGQACAKLEGEEGDFEQLPFWFRDWTAFGWWGIRQ